MGKKYAAAQAIFALGPHQANFQTDAVFDDDPKNCRQIVKEGYDFAEFDSASVDNAGESTGSALPDEIYPTRDSTRASAVQQLSFQLLGIHAFDAFGIVTTEVVLANQVWKHTFELLDPFINAILPCRPLIIKGGGEVAVQANQIYDALMKSMTYSRFTLTADSSSQKPNLQLSSEWVGSGQFTEPSNLQFFGTGGKVIGRKDIIAAHNARINKFGGVVTFYPEEEFAGGAIATDCIVRNFSTSIDEGLNVEGGYGVCGLFQDGDPTKGAIAGSLDTGGQKVDSSVTMDADSDFISDFELYERIKKKTPFSMKTVYTGDIITGAHRHKATFLYRKAAVVGHGFPEIAGGKRGLNLNLGMLSQGNKQPFALELITNVADFGTYMGLAPA